MELCLGFLNCILYTRKNTEKDIEQFSYAQETDIFIEVF